jgi:uncharacterized cupin superfamily protein
MSASLIETAKLTVDLTPRPIEPSWIIEGYPEARSCLLSQSADGLASTMVWECSEGRFNWYYDFDKTILILEGSIVLEGDTMPATSSSSGTERMRGGMSRAGSRSSPSAARPSRCGSALRCAYSQS